MQTVTTIDEPLRSVNLNNDNIKKRQVGKLVKLKRIVAVNENKADETPINLPMQESRTSWLEE